MSQPYDRTLKHLLDAYARDLLEQLFHLPLTADPVQSLPTELSADTRTADALWRVRLQGEPESLVHVEIQTHYEPAMPARLLDYAARIYLKYQTPVRTWLLLLLPPASTQEPLPAELRWGDPLAGSGLLFRYETVRVWELAPELGLDQPGLLPLYPLMNHARRSVELLDRCLERLQGWELGEDERVRLLESLGSLASLRYNRDELLEWLRRVNMVETPLMQWLRDEGRAEGEARGEARGKAEGKAEGEAQALLTILSARGLPITAEQRERILSCQDLALLEQWLKKAVSATSTAEVLD